MTVAILVPFGGSECPHRTQAHRWVTDRYRRLHGNWELVTGTCAEPWSKGTAVHNAYQQTDADILVIADADSFVDVDTLNNCVDQVTRSHKWAMPHGLVHRLDQAHTEKIYNGWNIPAQLSWQQLARPAYPGVIGGGITILSRDAYEHVGGIDPRFHGWGGEDICFGYSLLAMVGLPHRLRRNLYHLWHPHALGDQADTLRGSVESETLVAEYKAARRSPEMMREVLSQWTQPAS